LTREAGIEDLDSGLSLRKPLFILSQAPVSF